MKKLFETIKQSPASFLTSHRGADFEDRIEALIRDIGYTKVLKGDIATERWQEIKDFVIKKEEVSFMEPRPEEVNTFLRQPYGTQQYPDFLVFTKGGILAIETKFTRGNSKRPVWNSGLPRANGIYIFGSFNRRDITFFCGKDIFTEERRKALHGFFAPLKEAERQFNARLDEQDESVEQNAGFRVYVRRAFQQTSINGNGFCFFTNSRREELEEEVINLMTSYE